MRIDREKLARHEEEVRTRLHEDYDPADLDEFGLDHIEVKDRQKKTRYPFEGFKVWLLPYGSSDLLTGVFDMDEDRNAEGLLKICQGLSEVIAGWTVFDLRGNPRPQPYRNVDAIRALPAEAVYGLYGLVTRGESRTDRKNGSHGGHGGTSTHGSTGTTTPS